MTAANYRKTIRVRASADTVFEALTTASGLTAWWTPCTGSGDTGGELQFAMNAPEPLTVHVDAATRPALVQWTVTECSFEPAWVGTRPTFTVTAIDAETSEFTFVHHGLTAELDCIDVCTNGWNHFLGSLHDYIESGVGHPNGSPADAARREKESA